MKFSNSQPFIADRHFELDFLIPPSDFQATSMFTHLLMIILMMLKVSVRRRRPSPLSFIKFKISAQFDDIFSWVWMQGDRAVQTVVNLEILSELCVQVSLVLRVFLWALCDWRKFCSYESGQWKPENEENLLFLKTGAMVTPKTVVKWCVWSSICAGSVQPGLVNTTGLVDFLYDLVNVNPWCLRRTFYSDEELSFQPTSAAKGLK